MTAREDTPSEYIVCDPEDGWQQYNDKATALKHFDRAAEEISDTARSDGEWPESVDSLALYELTPIRTAELVGNEVDGFSLSVTDHLHH